jgi:sensor histidine kinase YesM
MFFDNSSKKYLTLENEVDLLKRYLEIEKMRFGEDFHYKFKIDKKLNNNTLIPTMLLQPIVENAVNHGIFHNNRNGNLLISFIYIDTNSFKVSVIDDGIGIKKSQEIKANSLKKHNSKSTSIINDRLQLLNQSKEWVVSMKTIDLTENNKTGTKVDLTFKKIK